MLQFCRKITSTVPKKIFTPLEERTEKVQSGTSVLYWCSLLPYVLIFEPYENFNSGTEPDVSEYVISFWHIQAKSGLHD